MKYERKLEKEIMCPIEYGLEIFGGKWKARIVCVLSSKDIMRYSEIRRVLTNITDAVLTAMLKDLIKDGIVSRKQYNEIPPRVEYCLTENGKTILPVLQNVCKWSQEQVESEVSMKLPICQSCSQHINRT